MSMNANPEPSRADLASLLSRTAGGDPTAGQDLLPLVYDELRRVAAGYLRQQRPDHTLQPTALVHEAYLRLIGPGAAEPGHDPRAAAFLSRSHFLAAAAVAMRHVLVDHARGRASAKRGAGAARVALGGPGGVDVAADDRREWEVLELDDLLRRLAELDPRRAKVVEYKFFAGMTNEQIAAALGTSRSTVADDWTVAKAWMAAELAG